MVALKAMGGLGPLLALAALLALLPLLTLAASGDSSTHGCTDHVVLFRLDSFRWKEKINDSMSTTDTTFLLEVIGKATCDDSLPPATLPLINVSLVYTSAQATIVNVIGEGSFDSPTMTLNFPLDITTIDFYKEVYYVVVASFDIVTSLGNEGEGGTVKTTWEAIQMNGDAKLAMTVTPGVIKGHYLEALDLTRLTKLGNVSLDHCEMAPYDIDACYFLQPDLGGEQAACVTQPWAATDGNVSILICDDTVQPVTVSETTNLDRVQLLYEDGAVAVTQTNNQNTTLELYDFSNGTTYVACEDQTAVDGSTRCSLAPFEPSQESYTFRMVELDIGGSPRSSREVIVQDFNVITRGISSDTVQVSWDSNNSSEFDVTISSATDKTFSGRVVNCNESPCYSFFIGLPDSWTNYKTAVRSAIGDDFGPEVVASLKGPPKNIITDKHNITRLNHYKDEILHTEACFEYNSDEPINARFLLIDSTGLFVESLVGNITWAGGMQDNNPTYCFESVDVPVEFITSDQTRILVNFEANNTIFNTQMDIFLFTPDIQQVSNTSARVTWQNLNSAEFSTSRAPGFENHPETQQLECSYTRDRCYYYVNEDQAGSGNFSLLETSEKLKQNSIVGLKMETIPQGLGIVTPFSVRNDELRVCFDAVPNADRYELGIELLGELVSSDQDAPIQMVSGKTCAVSKNPVTLGAYEEVWAVVVAYDVNSTILSAEEKRYEDMFLSPNRFVLAVTKGSTSPVTLRASWYIIDNTKGLYAYNINLVNANGATLTLEPVVIPKTTLDITINEEGLYTVCVSVNNRIGTPSEQTCSDIITVKFSSDLPDVAPTVANVHQFYTSNQTLKMSWDRPEDATAVLVSWSGGSPTHSSAGNRRAPRSMETATNTAFTPRKTEARESFRHGSAAATFSSQKADVPRSQARSLQRINDQADVPLSQARSLQRINDQADVPLSQVRSLQRTNNQIRRVTLPNIAGDGFMLVPASQSSLDIPLGEGTWNICVSAVNNHMAGADKCFKATFNSSDIEEVSPPTGLAFTKGVLTWTAPSDTTEGANYTYYIEFDGEAESISFTWNDTSLPVAEFVEAGQWTVAVHSARDSMYLSKELTTVIVVNGIKVTYEQTGLRSVTLSWQETSSESSEDEELTYSVTIVGVQSVNTTCSRATGCSVTFDGVEAAMEERLNVTVESQSSEGTKKELQIFFLDIGIVPANQLSREILANGSATVTWVCLEEVSFYNVSLVDRNGSVLSYGEQIMPCSYTFDQSTLTSLEEDAVLVQACLNSPGVVRCGDPQRMNLDVPGPATPDTSNVLVIVLSSVAAGLLVILMVAGIVFKLRSDRAKQPAGDATSNDGGSVHSLKTNSGSQTSVEPPSGQPRAALQANAPNSSPSAQNPSQLPDQRQTPVQYRSAAPATGIAQTQPLNRPIELSIRARQYPEVARAPFSSVNPNVRYDGPAQRNVPSNSGPQRFPQSAYPPTQRFSAPGLAANPNVRASGPVRMNVPAGQPRMNNGPAGQPRMNNVPSGPTYFSGQPRNLSQTARMNRPPSSQPIEVPGRFSGPPIAARPTHVYPTRAQARPTGLQMSAAPARYPPPPGQRSGPGPSSPTRPQAPGPRPIPRVGGGGGGGGYADMGPSPPGLRQTRQFSPERSVRQPQPQNPGSQVRNINGPNYNAERFF